MQSRSAEVHRKIDRLARALEVAGVRGVLLSAHWNFSWLTAGESNRIDISRETGAGALVVGADGRRFVLANAIEMPRLTTEALAGLGFEPVEFPWTAERGDPTLLVRRAVDVLGGWPLAADLVMPAAAGGDVQPFETEMMRLRTSLDADELPRYRALGTDVAAAVSTTLEAAPAGISEREIIRGVGVAILRSGARPLVLLAAGDQRLLLHRHPIPTEQLWIKRLMVGVCAERDGLVVALSRMLAVEHPDEVLARRLAAAQAVFAALLSASSSGAPASVLFDTAATAYAAAGFPGEERKHHQGGMTGYRSREWLAHPASLEQIRLPAALAWNPSVTGTKVEDTCLVTDEGVEVITATPRWPSSTADVNGRHIQIANHLVID